MAVWLLSKDLPWKPKNRFLDFIMPCKHLLNEIQWLITSWPGERVFTNIHQETEIAY